jgi:hypothetical protein
MSDSDGQTRLPTLVSPATMKVKNQKSRRVNTQQSPTFRIQDKYPVSLAEKSNYLMFS